MGCLISYKLVKPARARDLALGKLKKMAEAWAAVSLVLCPPPRSCNQWANMMGRSLQILRKHKAPRLNPCAGVYLASWTLRLHLLVNLPKGPLQALKWGDLGMKAFSKMNPDQKQWIQRFSQHSKTTASLRKALGPTCPPQMLSCMLCIYSDKGLQRFDEVWIQRHHKLITLMLDLHDKLFGFKPHPVVCLSAVADVLIGKRSSFGRVST